MLQQWLHWRNILVIIALAIVGGSIYYSNYLAKKIAREETIKIEQWAEAVKENTDPMQTPTKLTTKVLTQNSVDIPTILTTEKDSVLDYRNIDSLQVQKEPNYLAAQIAYFKQLHPVIEWTNPLDSTQINRVYYGESKLLNEVRYYPIIQLVVVTLFIAVLVVAQYTNYKSTQNQLWAGMAKETAHQLGTPVSSLKGWVEVLKEQQTDASIANEIAKDVYRLELISDRFSKIGSTPSLEEKNIVEQVRNMMDYIKKRAGAKVNFGLNHGAENDIQAMISPPLFDWVIENLLKNALDAMDGKGSIHINIKEQTTQVQIDVIDTGKGISKQHISKVFKPGFSTKKRGWGLGLTLTKRIVEQYHKGHIYISQTELGKGTTFTIILPKVASHV